MNAIVKHSEGEGQFLTFRVKDQIFGLAILQVREIIEYRNVTPVPLVPDFIQGILNLRGNAVPVIDVSRRFDWEKSVIGKLTCIIVTEIMYQGTKFELGLVVDAVNAVVKLDQENIENSPQFGANIHIDFISQVGKVDGKFVLLLNIAKLLDIAELKKLHDLSETTVSNPP